MKVIVLGGGVIGLCTAYYLARDGAQVTVIDRQSGPALETSFANAGQISPGYSAPWAAPGIPHKAIKWLLQQHAPLAIRPDGSAQQLKWMLQLLKNCTAERYQINKARMMQLAEYSRDCFIKLRNETAIAYEGRQLGTLQVFRTSRQVEAMQKDIAVLQECGVPYNVLDKDGILQAEPALATSIHKLQHIALQLPNDETGDCYLFCQSLVEQAEKLNVTFCWNQKIEQVLVDKKKITGIQIGDEIITADYYVIALGSYSPALLNQIGLDIPVYPVKGYSLTIPIVNAAAAPVSTVMDETYKVAITRFDQRIRVGGMAELAGFDLGLNPRRRATLEMVVHDLFPDGGNLAQTEFWTGLRPMTPDGTPVIGPTQFDNLFLNTGHGTLGWTMSAGSGRVVADMIHGRRPQIDVADLAMTRYSSHC